MENSFLNLYSEKIHDEFRKTIIHFLNSNRILDYEIIEEYALDKLELKDYLSRPILEIRDWFDSLVGLNFLKRFLIDETINELMIHSHYSYSYEKEGVLHHFEEQLSEKLNFEDYQVALEILGFQEKISWNFKNPLQSFDYKKYNHYFRATLLHYSVSKSQSSKLFLRRIRPQYFSLSDFEIDIKIKKILEKKIEQHENIIISGSTGSGKTSLLNVLVNETSTNEHLVILEDAKEIFRKSPLTTYFLSQDNIPGKSLIDYCSYSLRIRPDRIIIGEMRSKEVIPFILSMNSGHKGLMSSIHANSAIDSLSRMAILFSLFSNSPHINYLIILKMICKNIDCIIHLENKKIREIVDIIGCNQENPIYEILYEKNYSD